MVTAFHFSEKINADTAFQAFIRNIIADSLSGRNIHYKGVCPPVIALRAGRPTTSAPA
ncbi:hypothetical protein [Sneathiella sp.]|jgi:hypothetical protein|uniref:hypothetical protein n=1 Tax=Sneathiella sp. TaxID=1964365 RepID=UPI0025FDE38E|nr:hypothetical protein [Sneathiella sp.]|tara:strand:+ start:529 stop:702 length:174 start_codon:yes stop_codon:yes gene_type:complete